jgi:hypothetical protein
MQMNMAFERRTEHRTKRSMQGCDGSALYSGGVLAGTH